MADMAHQDIPPFDEPLDATPTIRTRLAEDINAAATYIRLIPALEALVALVADLRRIAAEYTAVSAGRLGDQQPQIVPARAGRRPDGDPAISRQRQHLTRREAEVLHLTEADHSAAQIAKQLHTTVRTVYTHRRNA